MLLLCMHSFVLESGSRCENAGQSLQFKDRGGVRSLSACFHWDHKPLKTFDVVTQNCRYLSVNVCVFFSQAVGTQESESAPYSCCYSSIHLTADLAYQTFFCMCIISILEPITGVGTLTEWIKLELRPTIIEYKFVPLSE